MDILGIAIVATLLGSGIGCFIVGFILENKRLDDVMSRVFIDTRGN